MMRLVILCLTALVPVAAAGATGGVGLEAEGRIAFVVQRAKVDLIAVRRVSGGPVRLVRPPRLGSKPVDVASIAWSPRVDRLAYSDTAGRIYVAGAASTRPRFVGAPAGLGLRNVFVHAWSPDGQQLAVVTSVRGCKAGEPRLFMVPANGGRSRALPAHPPGAPVASDSNHAFISPVAWSPDGSQLVYGWHQYRGGDCRDMGGSNRPTRVMTIRPNGTGKTQIAQKYLVYHAVWSPSGRAIALARACGDDDPLAWTPNEEEVVIATGFDGCAISIVDLTRGAIGEVSLSPSRDGEDAVVYAVNSATVKARMLRRLDDPFPIALGTIPNGGGVLTLVADRLTILHLDGSPLVTLPALKPPKGMTKGGPIAAGFVGGP
jgi:dipeptidyl aminopeptidase/acylaminoacyl peptidase